MVGRRPAEVGILQAAGEICGTSFRRGGALRHHWLVASRALAAVGVVRNSRGAPGQSLYLAYAPRRRAHCMSGIPLVHGVGSQSLARSMEGADHHVGISGLGARCVRLCPDFPQCSGTICGSIAVSVSASVPVDAALACAVAPSGTLECRRPCPARAYFR